jgi:High potential iron-sulfur protein
MPMKNPTRRTIVRRLLQVLSALAVAPLAIERASAAASCSDASSESLRASLNYKDASPVPAQSCSACAFFTAGGKCGNCSIMSDKVDPKGHCDSWSAKG